MFKLDCWENETTVDTAKTCGTVTVEVPARFDFIGGWTDTPPYHFKNNACVLNATVILDGGNGDKRGEKAIKITVSKSDRLVVIENNEKVERPEDHMIIGYTLRFLELERPDISIAISNSIPKGSGLGGSSILVASLLASLWAYYKGADYIRNNLNKLINNVLFIEQLMDSGGGWQDQIGGIFPGIKCIETSPGDACHYTISYIEYSCETLNRNSLIIDTRIQRKASKILHSIRQKYVDGDPDTVAMLKKIAANAKLGYNMLAQNDIVTFAGLLSESWKMVNEIEYGAVESVVELKKMCGGDSIGLKMGGAGGGGFILAVFLDEDRKEFYTGKIRENFPECLIYRPCFGCSGMSVSQNGLLYRIEKEKYV